MTARSQRRQTQDQLDAAQRRCDDWHHGRGDDGHDRRTEAFRAASRACETAVASLAAQIEIALKR